MRVVCCFVPQSASFSSLCFFLSVDTGCVVAYVDGFYDFYASGITVRMYDCGVVNEELTCQCCVVFVLHVCFDGSVLSVHCEASRQCSPCEANVTVSPRPTILGWAIKFVQHVGSHETLSL